MTHTSSLAPLYERKRTILKIPSLLKSNLGLQKYGRVQKKYLDIWEDQG